MKIVILTEGGRNIGFGHISRCCALYDAFAEKGIKPCLLINSDIAAGKALEGRNYKILNWLKDQRGLFTIIKRPDIAIIDSYLAGKGLYRKIADRARTAVYIDDNNRIDYPEGIVINGSIYAEELDYPKAGHVDHVLGVKYALLRKEFWRVRNKRIRDEIKTAMITFGGDDSRGMTPKVLKLLVEKYPKLSKKVIIGSAFRNISRIENAKDHKTELIYGPSAKKMKCLMFESDIAISAGGQTLYELSCLGTPAIVVKAADNQANNVKGFQRNRIVKYIGRWDDSDILSGIEKGVREMRGKIKRHLLSRRAVSLVDGQGARRVAGYILKAYDEKQF